MSYSENYSIMQFSNCIERFDPFPLDRTDLHFSYTDALAYAKGYIDEVNPEKNDSRGLSPTAYIGQIITVLGPNEFNKDGVWQYSLVPASAESKQADPKRLADLKPIGGYFEIDTATSYEDAVIASKFLRIGQLIKVQSSPTEKGTFYIVEGSGKISVLGTGGEIVNEENELSAPIHITLETLKGLFNGSITWLGDFDALGIDSDTDFTKTDICVGGYYPAQKKILNNSVEFYYYTIEEPTLDRISLSMDTSDYTIVGSWTDVKITKDELKELFETPQSS